VVEQGDGGPGFWSIAGWVVAALAVAGAGVAVLRGRHRATEAPDEEPEDEAGGDDEPGGEKEPVGAGGKSTWRYSG
jgi:hypothetical protein